MVKDINPGPAGSNPSDLTSVDGELVLRGVPTTRPGTELWKSDGTAAGTVLVKDLQPGHRFELSPTTSPTSPGRCSSPATTRPPAPSCG